MEVKRYEVDNIGEQQVEAFDLINDHGVKLTCLNYGCRVTEWSFPSEDGEVDNLVLAYDDFAAYHRDAPFLGALVGRVGGRIAQASYEYNQQEEQLDKNQGPHHMHGGYTNFSNVVWKAEPFENETEVGVHFSYFSKDGESGYPGNLEAAVVYTLNNHNEWKITYSGTTDKATLFNPTQHAYFNLNGGKDTVAYHELEINGDYYVPLNESSIPTGEKREVAGTNFDFRNARPLQDVFINLDEQNELVGGGIDHPFILNHDEFPQVTVVDEKSGRTLTVTTDRDSVVVYTSNSLESKTKINGYPAFKHMAIAMETQMLPDAINQEGFGNTVLLPGEAFSSTTVYKISQK